MFPLRVSVKLTKSKVAGGGGEELILLGWFIILTCSFRWLRGYSKAGRGAPAFQSQHTVSITGFSKDSTHSGHFLISQPSEALKWTSSFQEQDFFKGLGSYTNSCYRKNILKERAKGTKYNRKCWRSLHNHSDDCLHPQVIIALQLLQ